MQKTPDLWSRNPGKTYRQSDPGRRKKTERKTIQISRTLRSTLVRTRFAGAAHANAKKRQRSDDTESNERGIDDAIAARPEVSRLDQMTTDRRSAGRAAAHGTRETVSRLSLVLQASGLSAPPARCEAPLLPLLGTDLTAGHEIAHIGRNSFYVLGPSCPENKHYNKIQNIAAGKLMVGLWTENGLTVNRKPWSKVFISPWYISVN